MNAEESFDDYVNEIEHEEAGEIGLYLVRIAKFPSGDKRMLSYLEAYLDDSRPTRVYIEPIHYAEIRYAAGKALAAERAVQGVDEAVRVPASVIPLTSGEMRDLAREAQIDFNLNPIKLLPLLIEKKLVPKRNHIFPARIPPRWSTEVRRQD